MHFRGLVCRVVVQDDVDLLILEERCRVIQEGDEVLLPMSLIVLPNHRAVEDVECGEQGVKILYGAIPLNSPISICCGGFDSGKHMFRVPERA